MKFKANLLLELDFQKRGGLLPVIVQDSSTKEVLILAWLNEAAWQASLESQRATFWSTSRQELWQKGLTSGDGLEIEEIRVDCDQDAVIFLVRPLGQGACHTKNQAGQSRRSCFYRRLNLKEQPPRWFNLEP